ncbi:TPA: hypothetical protein I7665_20600, partial [Vibrio vulnificus]|nr:hypothetical protein [Vibrio vulnificus]
FVGNFRNSPLWLIGFFILFAEATAGIAAINISGWPQGALVIFVIAYSTVVTCIFFAFLWFKPENFYGPSEYPQGLTPQMYIDALKGLPINTVEAVSKLESGDLNNQQLFTVLDNLIPNGEKQVLISLYKNDGHLSFDTELNYQFITEKKGYSTGWLEVAELNQKLQGTELLIASAHGLILSEKGKAFALWLVEHGKQAKAFTSNVGDWGDKELIINFLNGIKST